MVSQRDFFSRPQLVLMSLDERRILKGVERRTGLPPVTIQRALRVLESLGLVRSEKRGRMRFVETTEKGSKVRDLLIEIWDLLSE